LEAGKGRGGKKKREGMAGQAVEGPLRLR